jgi:hypothetical protein
VLDDNKSILTHLLPAGLAGNWFFASTAVLGCRLVEAISASRNKNFELLMQAEFG